MSTRLTAKVRTKYEWVFENTADDTSTPKDDANVNIVNSFTDGDGANETNKMFRDRRRLTLSTGTDDLDLSGGVTDQFGNTVNFREIKGILIHNMGEPDGSGGHTPTAGQDIQIDLTVGNSWDWGGEGTNRKLRIRSGGTRSISAPIDGHTITPGVNDILRIVHAGSAASGGDIDYEIVIFGT